MWKSENAIKLHRQCNSQLSSSSLVSNSGDSDDANLLLLIFLNVIATFAANRVGSRKHLIYARVCDTNGELVSAAAYAKSLQKRSSSRVFLLVVPGGKYSGGGGGGCGGVALQFVVQ